jgi:hypothetical protein
VVTAAVELSELSRVAGKLVGSPDVGTWGCEELHEAVASATVGICRVTADDWSAVLKLVGLGTGGHPNWKAGGQPEHWYYWRREVLAYQSGLVASLTGGLRAPECYLISERVDGNVALWLEDLRGATPAVLWPLRRYSVAARHLGHAQGTFVDRRPLPDEAWLSRSWLRAYLTQRDVDIRLLEDEAAWAIPLVREWLSDSLAGPLLDMRGDQESFLRALDRAPNTVCHFDLHPANLFGADDETILIDWSFVGIGAIGEDAGNLVPDAVLDFHVAPEHIDELYDIVRDGYLEGLKEAGWAGSEEMIDLAMRATIAAKYAWIAPAMLRAAVDRRDSLNKRAIRDTFRWWAPVIPFLIKCAEQTRRLIEATA